MDKDLKSLLDDISDYLVSQPPEYLASKDRLDPTALLHRAYNLIISIEFSEDR
jgi:hypothetical protein